MSWLLEERQAAIMVVVVGIITLVVLGFGWTKTGRKEILYALVAALLLCGGLLVLQRLVTTERERVEATLVQIARDVERNDLAAAVEHVHSRAQQIRDRVQSEFPNYRFNVVKITQIREIIVEPDRLPPKAVAKFSVVVEGTDASGMLDGQRIPRYAEVTFHKENGRWKVFDYEHYEPQRAIMK